jgi:hypothetical protein
MIVVTYLPAVVGVAVAGEYRLRLPFDDGTHGDIGTPRSRQFENGRHFVLDGAEEIHA